MAFATTSHFVLSAGKMEAGNYTEVTKDDPDLKTCVEDCCLKKSECNVAFMYDKKCYHIKCISNELCLPKQRTDGLSTNLQMVLVTPVNDGELFINLCGD